MMQRELREREGGERRRRENSRQDGIGQIGAIHRQLLTSPIHPHLLLSIPLSPPQFHPQDHTMAPSRSSASWLSSALAVCAILCLTVPANALYFYMDGRQTKCFFEELPKDTLVVGRLPPFPPPFSPYPSNKSIMRKRHLLHRRDQRTNQHLQCGPQPEDARDCR